MVKTKFKHTDIGLIPEDWEVKTLGEVGEIIMGQSPLSENYNQNGIGFPLVQGNADIEKRKTIIRNYTSQITKKGKNGDIIMSVRAPVGEIAIATFDCCLGRGVCAIRSENDYIYNYLIYSENRWRKFSTGSTFDSVNSNQINEFLMVIPKSNSEQQAIAEVLSDTDRWIESLENLIVKKQLIKQGAMQKLLTPKEDWEVKKLGEVGEIFTGGTPSTTNKNFWGGSIPWITPTDISTNKNIYIGERNISELGLKQIRPLPENALLVTCIASIGKNAILRKSGACNQQINAVVTSENYSVDYLYYLLELNKSVLQVKAGVTATPILSKAEFSTIEFSFPSIKEQTQIATILSDMDAEIEILEQKLAKAQQIKQGLMQELLTGRKRLCGGFENLSHPTDA
ncbi:restriction endonuclease subunit S [Capnocytophaga canimorsus]|uniref:restriction endonuclease subunit S n=1 Tax=Capnocytophaga canimorsus TaxID=28188 RepID=UPI003859F917